MARSKISFLIFMILCVGGLTAMGVWQIKRLHWKEGLIQELDAVYAKDIEPPFVKPEAIAALPPGHFIRGMFRGHLDFPHAFFLLAQIDNDRSTSHTIVPYILSPDVTILVDFGPDFIPADKNNANAVITGLLRHAPKPNAFTPDNVPGKNLWYSFDPVQLKIKNLESFEILPEHTPWKDYPVQKPELRNAHLQYAIFWFSMAGIVALLTVCYFAKDRTAVTGEL